MSGATTEPSMSRTLSGQSVMSGMAGSDLYAGEGKPTQAIVSGESDVAYDGSARLDRRDGDQDDFGRVQSRVRWSDQPDQNYLGEDEAPILEQGDRYE